MYDGPRDGPDGDPATNPALRPDRGAPAPDVDDRRDQQRRAEARAVSPRPRFTLPPDPRIGRVINERYRILSPLGSGGMASVYLAEQLGIGGEVAIKFLRTDVARDKRFLRRFEVEARALAALDHPHCVSVRDFGVADVPYIVMPRVDGPTLYDEIVKGPLEPARCIAILRQLLAALGHAHERGIVHRDIKPDNVKLQQDTREHVRLLDFGLAKLRRPPAGMPPTNPLIAVGTPSYMSPEQFVAGSVDARTDIYSTGALLFELLTGRKPFEFERIADACRMHTTWPRPRLRNIAPERNFSAGLEDVILRAMALAPEDRFQTTQEFRAALDAVPEAARMPRPSGGGAVVAPADRTPTPEPKKPPRARARKPNRSQRRVHKTTMKLPSVRGRGGEPVARPRDSGGRGWLIALLLLAGLGIAAIEVPQVRDAAERLWRGEPAQRPAPPSGAAAVTPVTSDLTEPAGPLLEQADAAVDRGDWAQAMVLFGQAVRRDPSLVDSDRIYEPALEALGTRNGRRAAMKLIERDLGRNAIPHLEAFIASTDDRAGKRRAKRLLNRLQQSVERAAE